MSLIGKKNFETVVLCLCGCVSQSWIHIDALKKSFSGLYRCFGGSGVDGGGGDGGSGGLHGGGGGGGVE